MLRDYLNLPRSVHILCAGSFINRAGSFVLVFLTIYISEQLDLGATFATQCIGLFGVGSMIASLVGGQLADQYGRRVVMLFALFGGAGLLILMSLATSRAAILLSVLAYSVVAEMYRPAASALIGDLTDTRQRPHAFGLLYIAINLGFACGPPIGGLLADRSFTLLFWGDAGTMALFGLIVLAFIPESKPTFDSSASAMPDVPVREAARRILSDGPFVLFCVATVLIGIVFMQSVSTLPIFMTDHLGFSKSEFGRLIAVNGLLIFLFQLHLTHALDGFNHMGVIMLGGVLIAIGFGMFGAYYAVSWFIFAIVVFTVGEMMQAPFKHTVVNDLAPPELRGRCLGLFGMSYSLAQAIGSPLGGAVLTHWGPTVLWSGCCVLGLTAVGVYALTYRSISARRLAMAAD